MRQRALWGAFAICLLGCGSTKPGAQPSNDAGGKDVMAPMDTGASGDAPTDAGTTADVPAEAAPTGDATTDAPQSSNDATGSDAPAPTDAPGTHDGPADTSSSDVPASDGPAGEHPPPAPGKVYAHSADTLYLLEPISKQVTMVGMFDCTMSMVDIAVDKTGKMTGSAAISFENALGGALVTVDPTTAHCTELNRGPNLLTSLTYVPEGTLVANAEALVGYADDQYVRVDPTTGNLTNIGTLNNAVSGGTRWVSSGDVVSIKDGGTYLTVKPEGGTTDGKGDRIVEVDPKTGALVKIIGPTGMDDVLGLGYWGGVAYGFTLAGKLIQIDLKTGAGTTIAIPNATADLMFYGAGTTTVAPTTIIFE